MRSDRAGTEAGPGEPVMAAAVAGLATSEAPTLELLRMMPVVSSTP